VRSTTLTTLTALAVALTACAGGDDPGETAASTRTDVECTTTVDELRTAAAAGEDVAFPWDDPDAAVLDGFDTEEIRRGGPPPDGIRPIDDPCVAPLSGGDAWLDDDESVMVVEVDGEARAYPLAIMTQHEIVNDVLGGREVVVTYCPLCNSGLAFDRTVQGEVWDFGTSGRLLRSNLVMYDRQTRTLWSQFNGTALWGDPDVVGTELERLPTQVLAWDTFREANPDGTVLSRDSFPTRDYGRNPYPGYEDDPSGFLFRGETDDRLDPDERVVGIGEEESATAIPLSRLMEEQVVTVEGDDGRVTVVWAPGQASALDSTDVAGGRDVGQTGAFAVDGLEAVAENRFRDPATGAVHDVTGRVVEGDADPLEAVPLDDTFWFVWFAFQPRTTIATG
jgi:hypothetical protein